MVDAAQIQVVRRLVQYQQPVGRVGEQQLGQGAPESFAAGEVCDKPVDGVKNGGLVIEMIESMGEVTDPIGVPDRRDSAVLSSLGADERFQLAGSL